jgi:tRNA pseudouridine38-40 synthase
LTENVAQSRRCVKLVLEYDGTHFHGWQVQPSARTVMGEVERAIAQVTGETLRIHGASRTDVGVHALGQVASFATSSPLEPERLAAALNANLPDDVAVVAASIAPDSFHARHDARGKHYCFRWLDRKAPSPLERGRAVHVRGPLDVAAMDRAARALVGTHDFACFASRDPSVEEQRSTVRTITEARVERRGDLVLFDVAGDGFLYNMVRAVAGTLAEVGRGKRDAASIPDVIASRDRRRAGPTAPAHGLALVRVFYDESPRISREQESEREGRAPDAGAPLCEVVESQSPKRGEEEP